MKKMKFVLVTFLGFTVTFMACEKSTSSVNPSTTSALATSNSALSDYVFLATADSSSNSHAKENITPIALTALPASITSYISTNYSGSTIEKAGTLTSGNYIVGVLKADKTHVGLVFDSAGKFLEAKAPKNNNCTPVAIADLPAAIGTYIKAKYAGATIDNAMKTASGDFAVMITKADATKALLGFAADGTFKAELTMNAGPNGGGGPKGGGPAGGDSVAIADLPAAITTYITKQYAGAVIVNARKGPDGNYGVMIKKSDASMVVLGFKADGTFVAELAPPTKK